MKSVRLLAVVTGMVATATVVPIVSPSGAATPATCTHVSKTTSTWIRGTKGFTGSLKVTNLGKTPVKNWTITWSAGSKPTIVKLWTANWTQAGKTMTAKPTASNPAIYVGKAITFGFLATGAATPATNVRLNGALCS